MNKKLSEEARNKIEEAQKSLPDEPVAIVALCRQFGVPAIKKHDLPAGVSGCIRRNADGSYEIFYNGNEPITRQRFTVAHELAHYLLHKEQLADEHSENIMLRGSGLSNRQETEANELAADILMPSEAVDHYIKTHKGFSLSDMAKDFGVSAQAMSIRLRIPLEI